MEPTEPTPHGSGPTLFYAMLGLILTLILAFLILHPRPANGQTPQPPRTSCPASAS